MASGSYTFDVQDTSSVNAWKEAVERLNERAAKVVNEAAQLLQEFSQTAEGNIFEEVCKYSDGVISGMIKVLEGMNEILTAVNKLMTDIKGAIKDLVGGVGSTVSKVLG